MRMGDDVGMNVLSEMEANGDSLRTRPHRIVLGSRRIARRKRKPHGQRRRWPRDVRRLSEFRGFRRWSECAGIHQPLGVDRAESRMHAAGKTGEDFKQIAGKCGGHDMSLQMVCKR